MYSINAMRKLLVEGLEQFELQVNSFEVKHQGVQLDNIHCGAWTAANIASLVACRLPAKMQAFFPTDKERIIQANIEKVCPTKSGMCGSTNPSTDSLASTAGLSDDDTWEKVSSVSHI